VNKVLDFYNKKIEDTIILANEQTKQLSALYEKSNFWGVIILLYNIIILLPVNTIFAVIISKKWDNFLGHK
jgi:hypothetical protein